MILNNAVAKHTLYALGSAIAVGAVGLSQITNNPYIQLGCAMVGAFLVASGFGVAKRSQP